MTKIKTLKDVEAALQKISDNKRNRAAIKTKIQPKIATLKEELEAAISPYLEIENSLKAAIMQWGMKNLQEFKAKKTLKFPFGKITYRSTKKLVPMHMYNWDYVVKTITKKGWAKDGLSIKTSVAKNNVKKWPGEKLKAVGLKILNKDSITVSV
ncbi:hypothetical protein GMMP15_260012 [Candidatus Magnetomoraceae bacterium gMMP-15]